MSVYDIKEKSDRSKSPAFLGGNINIQRYDKLRYPQFEKLTDKQMSFFWRPEEVNLSRDSKDFKSLQPHEQHIFTSNVQRQIVLDSIQGRAPILAFGPLVSVPELETWMMTWSFFETIHSRSYTHIIRNIYNEPSKIFDSINKIEQIADCANDISKYYDELMKTTNPVMQYTHIWLALHAANALEGIRFYVSFACSWAFAELKKMEGNAKIIKLICRDENLHLAATQQLIKLLAQDDKHFKGCAKNETISEMVRDMFISVVDQEKAWAEYLFKDGSIIGLNTELLVEYIEWIGHKRMLALGIESPYKGGSNPLPWTQKWISGTEVQVAPQETEIANYTVGDIKQDLDENSFKEFKF